MPAYDWGGALVWKYRDWTFSGVGMNVGENDDGKNYNFYAAQAAYHIDTALGGWAPIGGAAAHRAAGQAAQLEQWVRLIDGGSHGLPGYAEALAVQQTIEALLVGR